jgi:hypothetical protein
MHRQGYFDFLLRILQLFHKRTGQVIGGFICSNP